MKEAVFITGATGVVGSDLTRYFLQNTDMHVLLLIHKKGAGIKKPRVLEEIVGVSAGNHKERVHLLYGDIRKEGIGLDKKEYTYILERTTHVIHSAASTRFDLPLGEARKINVVGAKNVVNLAKKCSKLKQFGFISTVYVSGKRTGVIYEELEENKVGFVNTYEQSKYEAEQLIRKEKGLPFAIYRLSTIIGDSESGVVRHFTAPHQALRIMYLGLASMLPGVPDYSVDFISSNYASFAIFKLFNDHFSVGDVYHVVAGKDKSYTLEELIDASYRYLAEYDPHWSAKNYPKPSIVSSKAFDDFVETAVKTKNPIVAGVASAMKHFAHQLNYPKAFDTVHIDSVAPKLKKSLPHIEEYYPKVVKYCLSTRWGKQLS